MARVVAQFSRVIIVDTSNEIAGDGDVPHPAIGRARRMQVAHRINQQRILLEAVQNHTPGSDCDLYLTQRCYNY